MDAEQREFYGTHGYLVVKDAIDPQLVARLNGDYDERVAAEYEALDYDANEQFDNEDVNMGEDEMMDDGGGYGGGDYDSDDDDGMGDSDGDDEDVLDDGARGIGKPIATTANRNLLLLSTGSIDIITR